jgi:hypothetical protein
MIAKIQWHGGDTNLRHFGGQGETSQTDTKVLFASDARQEQCLPIRDGLRQEFGSPLAGRANGKPGALASSASM